MGLRLFQNRQNAQQPGRITSAQAAAHPADSAHANVVVLAQHRRSGDAGHLHVSPDDNMRPSAENSRTGRILYWTGVTGFVLLLHSAVVLAFLGATEPKASVGVESISVEIVLGAQTAAGVASAPSESEAAAAPEPVSDPTPPEPAVAEKMPETPQPAVDAEALKRDKPVEKPPVEKPRPQKPQPKRQVTTTTTTTSAPSHAQPSTASSGIGQGRSSPESNYLGLVAAHLARHKRFPPEASASRSTGVATITFVIDGQGHFVEAQLTHSSGVPSLDAETQELVRRASPFPAPPSGQATSFTVPVNFSLRN